jgi:uncharacterized protein YciI
MRWIMSLLATSALLAFPVVQAETASSAGSAATRAAAPALQYLYVLRLVPRLHDDAAWTEADTAAVSRHFEHLKREAAAGKVILAGRTREPGDKTFGLVIFEAENDAAAQRFMDSDPAVVAGIMTASLHPYAVALQRQH